jgi:nitroreductase
MMDALEALLTTRSMRRFTKEPVSDEEVWTCLRAACQAPSGGNVQPWQFLVLRDAEAKRRIAEIYRRAYDRYEASLLAHLPPFRAAEERERFFRTMRAARHLAEHLAEVPVLVLVLAHRVDLGLEDEQGRLDIGPIWASVYPAVQNLMVAARALGIGSTLTTVIRVYQDEAREACGIPDRFEIAALVPLGRPRGRFAVAPRKPAEAVTHWDRFGERREGPA